MTQPIILIILIFLTQQSFGSTPSTSSPLVGMCPTDPQNPSSNMIRQWAFEILKRSNYSTPHEVTIINRHSGIGGHPAAASAHTKTIYFNETYHNKHSIGYKLATIGHEAIHIRHNHTTLAQDQERLADTESLALGACEQCGIEIAHYYAEHHKNHDKMRNATVHSILVNSCFYCNIPESIQEFSLISLERRKKLIALAKGASEKHYTTHPCDLERAFYLYELSQSPELKGKTCHFHHEKKQKRKIIIRKLLQEAQQIKKERNTKRSRDKNEILPAEETVKKQKLVI